MQNGPQLDRSVGLGIICGVGDRGEAVVSLLTELLETLPAPLDRAVQAIAVKTPEEVPGAVEACRAELVNLANTDAILKVGWEVDGREVGRVSVDHYLVWGEEDFGGAPPEIMALGKRFASDSVRVILLAASPVSDTSLLGQSAQEQGISFFLVGPEAYSKEQVTPEMVNGSVAGALLLMVLPGLELAPSPTPDRPVTLGLAALHGVLGRSRRQLARHVAEALVAEHTKPGKDVDPLAFKSERIEKLIGTHSFTALAPRFLDDRLYKVGRTKPIPAVLNWDAENVLHVKLDRAAVALGHPQGKEASWSHYLRRLSRAFDMTTAVRWRQQLESACSVLCAEVPSQLERAVVDLLRTVPHAPVLAKHVVQEIRRNHQENRGALADPSDSFEEALSNLDRAVADRPNPLMLSLRTMLWVVPAILVFAMVLHVLYQGARGVLFPVVFVALAITGTVLAVALRMTGARKRILDARDRAVDLLVGRQESILSRNIVGYLGDVLEAIAPSLDRMEARVDKEEEQYAAALGNLRSRIGETLKAPTTFEPMLAEPDEYRDALGKLNADIPGLVAEVGKEAHLSAVSTQEEFNRSYDDWITAWCDDLLAKKRGIQSLDLSEIWEIRRRRRGEGNLTQAIDSLRRRAVPLGVIQPGSETNVLVASIEVDRGDSMDASSAEERESSEEKQIDLNLDLPLIAFWRAGYTREAAGKP